MKKVFLVLALILASVCNMQVKAQKEQGLFNRLSVGVSASTLGIGIDASTTFNRYLMLRAGVDIMPGITIDTDVDVDLNVNGLDKSSTSVNVEGGLQRTQASLLLNVYPFKRSSFFVTGGAYFGGSKLVKIKGHSQELKDLYEQYGDQVGIIIGDYKLPIDENGNVTGGLKVNGFRPYLGLGFGRAVPYKRIGFMVELGAQFHGPRKVYSATGDVDNLLDQTDGDDDFTKAIDDLKVYPVLKFRICGRIF